MYILVVVQMDAIGGCDNTTFFGPFKSKTRAKESEIRVRRDYKDIVHIETKSIVTTYNVD